MIKNRQKTIELRLLDEKRRQIKVGDTIVFTDVETAQTLSATVTRLHFFDSFRQLYESLPLLKCGYTPQTVKDAKHEDMLNYYSEEQQKACGVVGIELCV